MGDEQIVSRNQAQMRRDSLLRRILDVVRTTVCVIPLDVTELPPLRVEMTDASARALAPLVEAIDILEAIIWASDGCHGHRGCMHSMEPWQRARALLADKWDADMNPEIEWPKTGWLEKEK